MKMCYCAHLHNIMDGKTKLAKLLFFGTTPRGRTNEVRTPELIFDAAPLPPFHRMS